MTWKCAAINHSITFYPDGKVGPCCQIKADYLKSSDVIYATDRFSDLLTTEPPEACETCVQKEHNNIPSLRQRFNEILNTENDSIQYLDFRNTNECNLKCRYCGPHFSNKWAEELGIQPATKKHKISTDLFLSENISHIYYTGGEPMMNGDHWQLLEQLVEKDYAKTITLDYNTNLTLLQYKKKNISQLWKKFKNVNLQVSIDAVGKPLEYIRSGSNWASIEKNMQIALAMENVNLSLSPVISILNIWWIDKLYDYAQQRNIKIRADILYGPDYLAVDVIPDDLKKLALDIVEKIQSKDTTILRVIQLINNNQNKDLFLHTISHIMYLDRIRNEKLFDLLPFDSITKQRVLKNYEYQ